VPASSDELQRLSPRPWSAAADFPCSCLRMLWSDSQSHAAVRVAATLSPRRRRASPTHGCVRTPLSDVHIVCGRAILGLRHMVSAAACTGVGWKVQGRAPIGGRALVRARLLLSCLGGDGGDGAGVGLALSGE
jgi:hypothetical protein